MKMLALTFAVALIALPLINGVASASEDQDLGIHCMAIGLCD